MFVFILVVVIVAILVVRSMAKDAKQREAEARREVERREVERRNLIVDIVDDAIAHFKAKCPPNTNLVASSRSFSISVWAEDYDNVMFSFNVCLKDGKYADLDHYLPPRHFRDQLRLKSPLDQAAEEVFKEVISNWGLTLADFDIERSGTTITGHLKKR